MKRASVHQPDGWIAYLNDRASALSAVWLLIVSSHLTPLGLWPPPAVAQETKLFASDGHETQYFGNSIAVSAGTLLVGAPQDDEFGRESPGAFGWGAGAAYVFERNAQGDWTGPQKLTAADAAAGGAWVASSVSTCRSRAARS